MHFRPQQKPKKDLLISRMLCSFLTAPFPNLPMVFAIGRGAAGICKALSSDRESSILHCLPGLGLSSLREKPRRCPIAQLFSQQESIAGPGVPPQALSWTHSLRWSFRNHSHTDLLGHLSAAVWCCKSGTCWHSAMVAGLHSQVEVCLLH